MKKYLPLLILVFVSPLLLFSDDASLEPISNKNIYFGRILPDVFSHRHGDEASKVFILGTTALSFKIKTNYYNSLSDEQYAKLPSVLKDHRVDTSMKISKISPDLSKFSVDITLRSEFLRNALSVASSSTSSSSKYSSKSSSLNNEAITITMRYAAEIISCDGEAMNFGPKSSNIRDKIADLAGNNFSEYLGCTLRLKLSTSDKQFASDPFNFSKNTSDLKSDFEASSSGYFIEELILSVGSHGIATLSTPSNLEKFGKCCNRPLSFSLSAELSESNVDRDSLLSAANNIFKLITEYSDLRAENAESITTLKEIKLADDSAFEKIREDLQSELLKLRNGFSELAIQDQFMALSIVGRAYHYSDEVSKRIEELLKNKPDQQKSIELQSTQ